MCVPDQRGNGIGLKLVNELIACARTLNTRRIVMDSYHTMTGAHRIYRSVGFMDVAAPADFPGKLASRFVFMEMELS
jgi:ribosomal protein S18 acetylase RimI-like enzyme